MAELIAWLPALFYALALVVAVWVSWEIRDWRPLAAAMLLALMEVPELLELFGGNDDGEIGDNELLIASFASLLAVALIAWLLRDRHRAMLAKQAGEKRLRDFAESASDWLWETDAELRFVYLSPNVEQILGVPPEWHYGKTREELLGDDDYDFDPSSWEEHVATMRARRPFRDFVYRRSGEGGESKWLRVSGRPAYDAKGAFSGYRGVASDVTDEMAMQSKVSEADERFRLALASFGQGFVLFDQNDRLVVCNEHLRAINDDISDVLQPGTSYERILRVAAERRGRDEDWVDERLELHRQGGAPFVERYPDGRWIRIEDRRTADDGYVGLWTDVTELKHTERALQARLEELRLITDNVPMLIARIDRDQRLRFVNRIAANWYGGTARELIGKRMDEVLPPATYAKLEPRFLKALAGERVWFEDVVVYPDGGERVVEIVYVPEVGTEGDIAGFFGLTVDVTQRRNVEQELDRFFAISVELFTIADLEGNIRRANEAWHEVLGYEVDEIGNRPLTEFVHPDDLADLRSLLGDLAEDNASRQIMVRLRHRDDSWRWIDGRWSSDVAAQRIYGTGQDVTDSRKAEEQLRQAQKMEAVGQLTGGIAHDFNNLLTVIQGNADMLQDMLPDDRVEVELIDGMARAADRGAELTRRLLAFSRQQPLSPKPTDLNELLDNVSRLLLRTLAGEIEVQISTDTTVSSALVDAGQLENALLNLSINARDAMPNGGKLTLSANDIVVDESMFDEGEPVAPGRYVEIAVSDTGTGMSREVIARAFDPFFTTKGVGKGSGLGLSMVYGFARQSDGFVRIYSELGQGTSIKLFLPAAPADARAEDVRSEGRDVAHGSETILLVEDDADVAVFTIAALKRLGYSVVEAQDGPCALRLVDDGCSFDMLLTDVALPGGLNGRQVAEEVRRRRPATKVLFTSGYARDALGRDGRLDEGLTFLPKPFTLALLAEKVREVLDAA